MGAIVYKYRGIWSAEAWRSFHGNPLKPTKIIGLSRKPLHTSISPPPRTLSIHLKRCTIPFLPPPPPPRAFLPPRAVVALEPPRVSLLMKVPYETPTPFHSFLTSLQHGYRSSITLFPSGRHARRYCTGTSIPVMEKRRLEERKLAR